MDLDTLCMSLDRHDVSLAWGYMISGGFSPGGLVPRPLNRRQTRFDTKAVVTSWGNHSYSSAPSARLELSLECR